MEQRLGMIAGIAALVVATPALGQEWQTVTSPDGRIVVDLAVDHGEAVYRARYNGKAILDRSRLGFRFKDAAPIDHDLALVASRATELDRPWTQPWGERRQMREHYRGLVATLAAPDGRKLGVEIRVFDDGFGFRYTLPGSAQLCLSMLGTTQVGMLDHTTLMAVMSQLSPTQIPGVDLTGHTCPIKAAASTPTLLHARSGHHNLVDTEEPLAARQFYSGSGCQGTGR